MNDMRLSVDVFFGSELAVLCAVVSALRMGPCHGFLSSTDPSNQSRFENVSFDIMLASRTHLGFVTSKTFKNS